MRSPNPAQFSIGNCCRGTPTLKLLLSVRPDRNAWRFSSLDRGLDSDSRVMVLGSYRAKRGEWDDVWPIGVPLHKDLGRLSQQRTIKPAPKDGTFTEAVIPV